MGTRGVSSRKYRRGTQNKIALRFAMAALAKDPTCCWCGCELTAETKKIEHLVPPLHGGKNTEDNIEIACAWCNQSKGCQTPEQFLIKSFSWMRSAIERHTYGVGFCSNQDISNKLMKNRGPGRPGGRLLMAHLQEYRDEITDQHIMTQRRRAWMEQD